MGTIRTNSRIKDTIEGTIKKIKDQSQTWILYTILTPIILTVSGIVFYLAEITQIRLFFWIYLSIIACISIGWWLWTLLIINQIIKAQGSVISMVNNISNDIKDIKKSILAEKPVDKS
jgi:hypothetical protein